MKGEVHILLGGFAVCGAGKPSSWPEGTRWVAYNDVHRDTIANCGACKAGLRWRCKGCGRVSTTAEIVAASSQDRCPGCGAEERFDGVAVRVPAAPPPGAVQRWVERAVGGHRSPPFSEQCTTWPWVVELRAALQEVHDLDSTIPTYAIGMRVLCIDVFPGHRGRIERFWIDDQGRGSATVSGAFYCAGMFLSDLVPDLTDRWSYLAVLDVLERLGAGGIEDPYGMPDPHERFAVKLDELRSLCLDGTCWYGEDHRDLEGTNLAIARALRAAVAAARADEEA